MNTVTAPVHPAVRRYSAGEISARDAAELMSGDATVHDVIYQLREAGLPLPCHRSSAADMERARKMFGLGG